MSIEKYKELYKLSIKVLKEEQDRFNRIDEKASKYFSVLAFLLGSYGFFGKWIIENIVPPHSYLEKLLVLLFIIIIMLLFITVLEILYVLRIQKIIKIPLNNEIIKFFDDNRLIDIYYTLTKGNKNAFSENIIVTQYKTRKLNNGYKLIIANFVMLLLFSFLYGVHYYKKNDLNNNKERIICMRDGSDKKHNNENDKPKSDINPPEYMTVTEGFDPIALVKIIEESKKEK